MPELFGICSERTEFLNEAFSHAIDSLPKSEEAIDLIAWENLVLIEMNVIARQCKTASELAYLYYKVGKAVGNIEAELATLADMMNNLINPDPGASLN